MARKAKPHEPPVVMALPQLTAFGGLSLEARGDYEAIEFVDLRLAGQVADDAAFLACRLERCDLDGLSMRRARVAECLVADMHAASLDVAESVWRDSLVTGPRLGAMSASGATWSSVRIRGGKLNFVDLTTACLTNVVFEACEIGELDLADAELRIVRFVGSSIDELTVAGARLTEVDLSGATLRAIRGIDGLRGATISPGQLVDLAPLLADHIGLRVRSA